MTDLPRFANIRTGGNMKPPRDYGLIRCVILGTLIGIALIVADPLGIVWGMQ